MRIEINVYGNPGLYRHLQDSFAAESTVHRTWTGAARRLVELEKKSETWARTTGQWGGWSVIVDGLDIDEPNGAFEGWWSGDLVDAARDSWCPSVVHTVAAKLQERYAELQEDSE